MADDTKIATPAPKNNIKKAPRQGKARLKSPVSAVSYKGDPNPNGAGATIHRQITSHPTFGKIKLSTGDFHCGGDEDYGLHSHFGDRALAGNLSVEDLYRSYKNTPHAPTSLLLKYAVHRIQNHAHYEDHAKGDQLDEAFIKKHRVGERNGHVAVDHLRGWLAMNSHLPSRLMKHRKALHKLITRGIGLNTRSINGETYVALRRGIRSVRMNKEHALASWTDDKDRAANYGVIHHAWVPLKDIWYSYDLGPEHCGGNFGPEDEFLVSDRGTKYQAEEKDVTRHNFRHRHIFSKASGVVPRNMPSHLFSSTQDEELAQAAQSLPGNSHDLDLLLEHNNAGDKTMDVICRQKWGGKLPNAGAAKFAPPDVVEKNIFDKVAKDGTMSQSYPMLAYAGLNKHMKPEHFGRIMNKILGSEYNNEVTSGIHHLLRPTTQLPKEMYPQVFARINKMDKGDDANKRAAMRALASNHHLPDSVRDDLLSFAESAPDNLRVLENLAMNPSHTEEDARRMLNLVESQKRKAEGMKNGHAKNAKIQALTETAWKIIEHSKLPEAKVNAILSQFDSKDEDERETALGFLSSAILKGDETTFGKAVSRPMEDIHAVNKAANFEKLKTEHANKLYDNNRKHLTIGGEFHWIHDMVSKLKKNKQDFVPLVSKAVRDTWDQPDLASFFCGIFDNNKEADWSGLKDLLPTTIKERMSEIEADYAKNTGSGSHYLFKYGGDQAFGKLQRINAAIIESVLHGERRKMVAEADDHVLKPLPAIDTMKKTEQFKSELGEWLAKMAVNPRHLEGIKKDTNEAGEHTVDHRGLMNAHPAEHEHSSVKHYRDHVLKSPDVVKPDGDKEVGITAKVIYRAGKEKFMVKPFHEKIAKGFEKHMHALHLGWAEMAMQHLYHAGGIGDMCSKVHVANHSVGRKERPMLVVHMHPHAQRAGYNMPETEKDDGIKADARKMGIMDFLTNNMDRHSQNIMYVPKAAAKPGQSRLLAIDHGRCFQYTNNYDSKWDNVPPGEQLEDSPYRYIGANGILSTGAGFEANDYKHTFEWWKQNSDKIRGAMKEMLNHIKEEHVRKHIYSNFSKRADLLDDMAHHGLENFGSSWSTTYVPIVRPHQHANSAQSLEPKVYNLEDPALSVKEDPSPKDDEALVEALRAQKARKKAKQPRKFVNHDQLKLPGMSKL